LNAIIELHDSRVADIVSIDYKVIARFSSAYLHKSEGRPGYDSGTGWVQEALLTFTDGTIKGIFPEWPCDVLNGDLVFDGKLLQNEIPVPFHAETPTELRLMFDSIQTIAIIGVGAELELLGEPRFVEEFRGFHNPPN
jgi:hypothetical protein